MVPVGDGILSPHERGVPPQNPPVHGWVLHTPWGYTIVPQGLELDMGDDHPAFTLGGGGCWESRCWWGGRWGSWLVGGGVRPSSRQCEAAHTVRRV